MVKQLSIVYVERKSLKSATESNMETVTSGAFGISPAEFRRNSGDSIKNGYIVMGLLLMGAGAAMQSYSYLGNPSASIKDSLFYGGYGPLALGSIFLFGATVHKNTSYPANR